MVENPLTPTLLIQQAVRQIIGALGEDPARDGLTKTPSRVARAFEELTSGYTQNPSVILASQFDNEDYDEMIIVKDVGFTSLCEHHLLPFTGFATIAYIPAHDKIVGISKLARLVECFARRLQVQERITTQIAHAINENLMPQGVGVIVRATHSCMAIRGVQKAAETVTSCMLGAFRVDAGARAELMALAKN